MTLAVGEAVSSAEFDLTPVQQAYYAYDQVVVAVPIRKLDESVVGVLSVIGPSNDGTYVSSDEAVDLVGMDALYGAAEAIGTVLSTDAVEWFV